MTQLLTNEKMAPEVLPFQFKLVASVCKLVSKQERRLADDQEKRLKDEEGMDQDSRLYASIQRMELERVKFVLKSYLRTRLAKIERHLLYIVEKDQSQLLSPAEIQFAFALYENRKNFLTETFFNKIPRDLNELEKDPVPDYMVTAPNLGEFVFVRMLCEHDKLEILKNIEVQIQKDIIYFLPYHAVKQLLEAGQAELV